MHRKSAVTAVRAAAIGGLMAAGLGTAHPARAAQAAAVPVPCSSPALASAISSAAGGATLSLADGCTYVLIRSLPEVSRALTIIGNGSTLERSYHPGTAAFTVLRVGSGDLAISNLSFRHGNGAISVRGRGQLTVTGGTFTANSAADGGAIDINNVIAGPKLTGVTFIGNTATDSGGAVYSDSPSATVTIVNCTFAGNKAVNEGGAFWEFGLGVDGPVTASTFRGNTAGSGGALWLSENTGHVLSGLMITGNHASGNGGGIYAPGGGGGLDLGNSTVSGNHAGGQGGGIYNAAAQPSSLTGTAVHGNSAADGGGFYDAANAIVLFTDSTILGNHASANGGGVYNQGTVELAGSEIDRNMAPGGGGGIYDNGNSAVGTLTNSLVVANKPDNCEPTGSITGCTV